MTAQSMIRPNAPLGAHARRYRATLCGIALALSLATGLALVVGPGGFPAPAAVEATAAPSASTLLWVEIGNWNLQQAAAAEARAADAATEMYPVGIAEDAGG
jgi:hypothetical protein